MFRLVKSLPKHLCRVGAAILPVTLIILCSILPDSVAAPVEQPNAPEDCYCVGRVGNVNCDYRDEVTLADVMLLIDHLFISGVRLPNPEEANASGDPAGEISLADVTAMIDHLFISSQELPECPKPFNAPPETRFVGFIEGVSFINSVQPGSSSVGVRMRWSAMDLVDHAYDNPSFAFEFRLFGPYTAAELSDLQSQCIRRVFRTHDGRMFKYGDWSLLVYCDTIWMPGGGREIVCDTIVIDTLDNSNAFGWIDTLLDIESPDFAEYYRVADSSWDGQTTWTYQRRDSIYNVFANHPSDTTLKANFIAWVRARDPLDSTVCDPTPAFKRIEVIEPKHERDILILDYGIAGSENRAKPASNRAFWNAAIQDWITSTPGLGGVSYVLTRDWKYASNYSYSDLEVLLTDALRYKVVILLQDTPIGGAWSDQGERATTILGAIDAGVNAWVVARVPFGTQGFQSPRRVYDGSLDYQYFFGAARYAFPGWGSHLISNPGHYGLPRVEDFVGAFSEDTLRWPNIDIDTALLRTRYVWEGCVPSPSCYTDPLCDPTACFPFYPFSDTAFAFLGALPQVGWVLPTLDAEVMYTFKSLYGPIHAIDTALSFEGLPVMHRVDRGLFRSVHSCFSPLAIDSLQSQILVDSVLNWLYEPWLAPGANSPQISGRK